MLRLVVAMSPTGLPGDTGRAALTPLQIRFAEGTAELLHFGGAFVFIGAALADPSSVGRSASRPLR